MKRVSAVVTALILLVSFSGCGSGAKAGGTENTKPQTLTVFAAASLKQTFTELGGKFEQSHHGVTVQFSFAGSSDLVTQIQSGAPADVFASADLKNMDKAVHDNLMQGQPVPFATNTLMIAVPPDNPASISSFRDLTKPNIKLVICAAEVPCGSATQKVAKAAGVTLKPVSEESSVTDVLNKVTTGEADAGLVYVTDVKGVGDKVRGISFPESKKAVNSYPIAPLADSKNKSLADEFVSLVSGAEGQQVLAAAGFARP